MSDAPDRIIAGFRNQEGMVRWTGGVWEFDDTEYVRADLYENLEVERDRLRDRLLGLVQRWRFEGRNGADEWADEVEEAVGLETPSRK